MATTGKRISQNEYAKEVVGVNPATFSQWVNDNREPKGENITLLANVYGSQVYDRLGLARPLPNNPMLWEMAEIFNDLSPAEQREIFEVFIRVREANKVFAAPRK